jgi:PAS domain S-box-containing protein
MHIVVVFDLVFFLASLTALIMLLNGWKRAFRYDAKLLFAVVLIFTLFYSFCLVLEWSSITQALDPFEDLIGALLPMCWGFLFYAFLQEMVARDLRKSEERFRRLFEQSNDAIFLHQFGRIIDVNQKASEMLGFNKDQFINMTIESLNVEQNRKESRERIDTFRRGESLVFETQFRKADGEKIDMEVSSGVIDWERGITQGIARDITERKQAEEALRESEERYKELYNESKRAEEVYRSLLHTSADAIVIYDMEGKAKYINPSFTENFGWTPEEVKGKRITFLPESETEATIAGIKEIIEDGKGIQGFETKRYTKDGRIIDVSISGSRYNDHKGEPAGMLVILRDTSEKKKAERELLQAKETAEAGNQAKSEFLANMSHELRTPLNHIIGFTELILDKNFGELNEIQEEYLADVHQSSKHLLSLINDILDLSKVEAGKLQLESGNVNLKILLENSLMMFKEKAMKQEIQLTMDIDSIPETIKADERKFKQIVYNLLSNAVKFIPDGGKVHLSANRLSSGELKTDELQQRPNEGYVEISVMDTGIGIREEDRERIFDPFEQLENTASRRYPGTGLGLSLTKSLVELHGGRIWAESDGEGKGSIFKFVIPF